MKYTIYFILAMIVIIALCIFAFIKEGHAESPNYSNLSVAFATLGLIATAMYGFYTTKKATRMQTSMDFCTYIYPTLQSEEFVQREKYLTETLYAAYLAKQPACSFDSIKDDSLRHALYSYCECLNGIGLLTHEHMMETDVIVPYIGTNTTILYDLIKPYLDLTRKEKAKRSFEFYSVEENKKIQNAAKLYFAHYELLALQMREQGPEFTKQIRCKLRKERKKNDISDSDMLLENE